MFPILLKNLNTFKNVTNFLLVLEVVPGLNLILKPVLSSNTLFKF